MFGVISVSREFDQWSQPSDDMKLSHIMTDITNIFPLLLSVMRADRLLLPAININKGSISAVLFLLPAPCVWSNPSRKMSHLTFRVMIFELAGSAHLLLKLELSTNYSTLFIQYLMIAWLKISKKYCVIQSYKTERFIIYCDIFYCKLTFCLFHREFELGGICIILCFFPQLQHPSRDF